MSEFNEKRADALRDYMTNSTMYELFNRRWRLFVIKTFGREGLDDFSYRNALGTGDFSKILAPEKIMNPLISTTSTTFSYIALMKEPKMQILARTKRERL